MSDQDDQGGGSEREIYDAVRLASRALLSGAILHAGPDGKVTAGKGRLVDWRHFPAGEELLSGESAADVAILLVTLVGPAATLASVEAWETKQGGGREENPLLQRKRHYPVGGPTFEEAKVSVLDAMCLYNDKYKTPFRLRTDMWAALTADGFATGPAEDVRITDAGREALLAAGVEPWRQRRGNPSDVTLTSTRETSASMAQVSSCIDRQGNPARRPKRWSAPHGGPRTFVVEQDSYPVSASEQRLFGGVAVTYFLVWVEGDKAQTIRQLRGYGETPSDRKAHALQVFRTQAPQPHVPHGRRMPPPPGRPTPIPHERPRRRAPGPCWSSARSTSPRRWARCSRRPGAKTPTTAPARAQLARSGATAGTSSRRKTSRTSTGRPTGCGTTWSGT